MRKIIHRLEIKQLKIGMKGQVHYRWYIQCLISFKKIFFAIERERSLELLLDLSSFLIIQKSIIISGLVPKIVNTLYIFIYRLCIYEYDGF